MAHVDDLIAGSLDADPVLMPVLDYLLQDIEVLGGDPEQIVGMVRPLMMAGGVRLVLDLGCGKGVVATALAAELGLHVTGIDAFQPFVDEARTRASAMGIHDQCLFEVADMRQLVNRLPPFDIVLFVACGRIFGDMQQTISALRTFVRPRGFIVIGDLCRINGVAGANPEIPDHEAVASALISHGDRIVMEKHGLTQEAEETTAHATRVLERRARELMRLYPGLHASMWEYIETHRRDRVRHQGCLVPALWIVQKSEGPAGKGERLSRKGRNAEDQER
jgi:cyclopropane fatty-acyl-phospholipid synthase-like methyltransferase